MWIFCCCFFFRNICQAKVVSVMCVCTCTNLLVLKTEVKNVMYLNSIAMGQIYQCWCQSYAVLICLFIEINTFELSWVELSWVECITRIIVHVPHSVRDLRNMIFRLHEWPSVNQLRYFDWIIIGNPAVFFKTRYIKCLSFSWVLHTDITIFNCHTFVSL